MGAKDSTDLISVHLQPITVHDFMEAAEAFERSDLSVIVAKVEATGPDHYGMDLKLPENAFRFERFIRERLRRAVSA